VTFSEMTRCMTNGHGIETPANKIATAQATLGLAFRLSGEGEEGRITTEIFKRGITVHTGGDGLRLPSFPEGTDQNLKDGIFNIVLNALSASALTVDETLDEVFGKASTDTDLTRIGIAHAEGVAEPEDHAAILCEIMAGLANGHLPGAEESSRTIFESHMTPWIGRFFADLERAETASFYRRVGAVGRIFTEIETEAFTLPL